MIHKTAVLIGATGLIGSNLLEQLLRDPYFQTIRLVVRRPFENPDPRLEIVQIRFDDEIEFVNGLGKGDCIFCCIGTTNKKVKGDKSAYRKVDFEIAWQAARLGAMAGFRKFLLVSAVGANPFSKNFYLKLKGETESAVRGSGMKNIHIFRPSMLMGRRKEKRAGEMNGRLSCC